MSAVPVPVAPRREGDEASNGGGSMAETRNVNQAGQLPRETRHAMLQKLNPSNPLRIAVNGRPRIPPPPPPRSSIPRQAPTQVSLLSLSSLKSSLLSYRSCQQPSAANLNSRKYTNKFALFLFVLHLVASVALAGFLVFKGIQGLVMPSSGKNSDMKMLKLFLPQAEAASLLSLLLAVLWQQAFRYWPLYMVNVILWGSVVSSLTAGSLVICFERAETDGLGVCLILFAIASGLYVCWVNPRIDFCSKVLEKSLQPVPNLKDLNYPTYVMLTSAFLFMSFWVFAIIGALDFYWPPVVIIVLVLSFAWTAEVMRNVVNQTICRVVSLYYLRGMQSGTKLSFQRALSNNLGSACLGSLFVPTIEALRIISKGLEMLEGEDEFMFSCADCCSNVMKAVFNNGNGWAYVQIATYGKSFVRASQDTWQLFEKQKMTALLEADITSSVCFLTGICSGSICIIVVAAWTQNVHPPYTATVSLLAAFIGYLMTRIAMALPQACVSCYYVCYAEDPDNSSFDKTIKDRIQLLEGDGSVFAGTPRLPRRVS